MGIKLENNINFVVKEIGNGSPIIIKRFFIGKDEPIEAVTMYINGLVSKDTIDRDILNPLMLHVNENLVIDQNTVDYVSKRYIPMSNTTIEENINNVVEAIKSGKTALFIGDLEKFIILDTTGGEHRTISDPLNESAVRGSREGFVENLETNISILRRKIKDKNLTIENFKVGRRSQTSLVIAYIDDIVDKNVLIEVRKRIISIDVDFVTDTGMIDQYIEDSAYSIFPQIYVTERPDIVKADIMEGRVAIILDGTPFALTAPAVFVQFFQGVEDYNDRTIVASFSRILRLIAIFIVITLPSLYLTLINYNIELIPVKFINPIIESRNGIALTPFLEILSMEVFVDFLREGGLRLPPKIASTLSIVGGIIIGNMAVQSKIVSPTTLLIVGISVVSTFLIPNYEMSLSIRFIRFPMLVLADILGFLGIAAGWLFIIIHLSSLESFGVPYFSIKSSDLKDIFIRAPLWKMNKRPKSIPNNNSVRQSDFRKNMRSNKNE